MNPISLCQEFLATLWADVTCAFSPSQWRSVIGTLSRSKPKQLVRNVLLIVPQIIVFYVLISPVVAMPLYNKILFFPVKTLAFDMDKVGGVAKEDVWIPVKNSSKSKFVHGWFFAKSGARDCVLISHGNGGNISYRVPLIKMLLSNNMSVLAYDYEGYGKSEGEPSIDNVCTDGLAAFDYLIEKRRVPPENIILYGESLGGGITCQIAAERRCKAIILQSTFSSLPSVAKRKMLLFRMYPSILFPKNALDSVAVLEKKHAPLLIVHGELDGIIPIAESEILFERASQPKYFVRLPNAEHNDVYTNNQADLSKAVAAFIDEQLPK